MRLYNGYRFDHGLRPCGRLRVYCPECDERPKHDAEKLRKYPRLPHRWLGTGAPIKEEEEDDEDKEDPLVAVVRPAHESLVARHNKYQAAFETTPPEEVKSILWDVAAQLIRDEVVLYPLIDKHFGVNRHRSRWTSEFHQLTRRSIFEVSVGVGVLKAANLAKKVKEIVEGLFKYYDIIIDFLPSLTEKLRLESKNEKLVNKTVELLHRCTKFDASKYEKGSKDAPYETIDALLSSNISILHVRLHSLPRWRGKV